MKILNYILLSLLCMQSSSTIQANNRAMLALLAGGSTAMIGLFEAAGRQDWLENEGSRASAGNDDGDFDKAATQIAATAQSDLINNARIERNKALMFAAAGIGLCYFGWSRLE